MSRISFKQSNGSVDRHRESLMHDVGVLNSSNCKLNYLNTIGDEHDKIHFLFL